MIINKAIFHCLAPLFLLALLTGCPSDDTTDTAGTDNAGPITLSGVEPQFFDYGSDWNDYVLGDVSTATDDYCPEYGNTACVHGGERRMVIVNGRSTCAGITAEDTLNAFNWVCDDSTSPVRVISTGLADGKNLSDLIDFTMPAFKSNAVTVSENGAVAASTTSEIWWFNPVTVNNAGGSLTERWTIYLVTTDTTAAYDFNYMEHAALVVQPGITLSGPATGGNVVTTSTRFNWFEGRIDATGDAVGVKLNNSTFSVLRDVEVVNAGTAGIDSQYSNRNRFEYVTANNNLTGINLNVTDSHSFFSVTANDNASSGIQSQNGVNHTFASVTANGNGSVGVSNYIATNNRFSQLIVNNNAQGFSLGNSTANVVSELIANNNVNNGVSISASSDNRLIGVSSNNNGNGIYLVLNSENNFISGAMTSNNSGSGITISQGPAHNALTGVTSSNNGWHGIDFNNNAVNNSLKGITTNNNGQNGVNVAYTSPNNHLTEVAAGFNGGAGISLIYSNNTLANLALANNAQYGIYLNGYYSKNNILSGWLEVGNNTLSECYVLYGSTHSGVDDSTCANNGQSNATLSANITLTNSFAGNVYSDDIQNSSDTDGLASYPADAALFDWSRFDNVYRSWSNADASAGQWVVNDGRIFDWSISTADSGNTSFATPALLAKLPLPTGNATLSHSWTDNSISTFLRSAVELPETGGNNNGLCESNETCLYTPNIGSYQGHGNLISAGDFVDGTLTGITLLMFEFNGRDPEVNPAL